MKKLKMPLPSFSRGEIMLWGISVGTVLLFFLIFDRESGLTLAASLVGVTSLIFSAKGSPAGQLLMIIFSLLYGIISFSFSYYGEMLTYLGMTMPMSVFALASWLRNPYDGAGSEVRVNSISKRETLLMCLIAAIVTGGFYFVLEWFGTANLIPSTISVTTSFVAVYLTFRRSPFFAAAYAANDAVLIVLWLMASAEDARYLSVTVCFVIFLINDLYGFFCWQRMKKRQQGGSPKIECGKISD